MGTGGTRSSVVALAVAAVVQGLAAADSTAQSSSQEGASQLEEVLVTATKRTLSVQEVGATVRALDTETLAGLDAQSLSDVVVLLPNVNMKGAPAGEITIRGVAQSRLGQSPVSFHVNGIFKYSFESTVGQFYDLASVEVIQGPTGTVYGRNSTAGSINIIQQPPTSKLEAFADVNIGNYDHQQFRGGVNIPFFGEGDERLMGRFVFQSEEHDGYIENDLAPEDKHYGAADNVFMRGALRSVFSDTSSITVRAFRNENKDNYEGGTQRFSEYPVGVLEATGSPFDVYDGLTAFKSDPTIQTIGSLYQSIVDPSLSQDEAVEAGLLNGVPGIFDPILASDAFFTPAARPVLGEDEARSNAFLLGRPELRITGVDGEFVTSFSELPVLGDVRMNILAGWENTKRDTISDIDGTELPVLDAIREEETDLYSVEARLTSENDGNLTWILGAFHFGRDYELSRSDSFTPFGVFGLTQDIEERGLGLFFSGEYQLGDSWQIFGGLRWNEDTFDLTQSSGGGGIGEDVAFSGDDEFSEVTGEIGAKYNFNDNAMVYAKYNHGYKSGSLELRADGEINSVQPELIDALEVGVKTEWWNNRLRVNATAFYYDYTDLQVPIITAALEFTENAGEATVWGVELDASYLITPNWEIQGSLGYLDATFDEFCAADEFQIQQLGATTDPACAGGSDGEPVREGTLDLSGNTLEDAPEWKAVLLTSYNLDFNDWGALRFTLQSTWTDSYYLRPFNLDADQVDSFSSTDIRVLWNSPNGAFDVEAYVQNLEDEVVAQRIVTLPDFTGGQLVNFGMTLPRLYGVRFRYRFGQD